MLHYHVLGRLSKLRGSAALCGLTNWCLIAIQQYKTQFNKCSVTRKKKIKRIRVGNTSQKGNMLIPRISIFTTSDMRTRLITIEPYSG